MYNHLDELNIFNSNEIFYKEYYYAKINDKLEQFKLKYDSETIKKNMWNCPDILEYEHESYDFESIFKKNGNQDIVLYKHPRYTPEFFHSHEYFEIFYVLKGECRHTIHDDCTILKEGTLFFIAPKTYHSIGVFDDNTIVINFLIKPTLLKKLFLYDMSSENILSEFFLSNLYSLHRIESLIIYNVTNNLKEIINLMLNEQHTKSPYYSLVLNNLISLFFYFLLRNNKDFCDVRIISSSRTNLSNNMLSYIFNNYNNVTLSSLSEKYNYSIAHCSRIIKQETGKTFSKIIQEIRLSRAKDLLKETSLTIEEICIEVGYESISSFQRTFKSYTHTTPGNYRLTYKSILK